MRGSVWLVLLLASRVWAGATYGGAGSSGAAADSCPTCTSADQNNAGVNAFALFGNGSGTSGAVDCATNGLAKKLTLLNDNKTDADAARDWALCFGTTQGPTFDASAPAGNHYLNSLTTLQTCGSGTTSCVFGIDTHGTVTMASTPIVSTGEGPSLLFCMEDFVGTAPDTTLNGSAAVGKCELGQVAAQTCAGTNPTSTANHPGIYHQVTDGTANHVCALRFAKATNPLLGYWNQSGWYIEAMVTPTTTAEWFWFGLADSANIPSAGWNNAMGILQTSTANSGHYVCHACGASTCGTVGTGDVDMGAVGTNDKLRVDMSDSTHLRCTLNGVASLVTTNLPAAATAMNLYEQFQATDAVARGYDTDYITYSFPLTR